MGLFGKKKEQLPPEVERQDFADAISGAPSDEMKYLNYGRDELAYLEDYFGENIPNDETVLAIASSCYPTARVSFGIIATTSKRIIAAIGSEHKNGQLVGNPRLYEFPIAHVSVETQPWGTGGYLATFEVTRQSPIQLQVANDMGWGRRFFDTVNRQITATL
ncbi:hypothetical protein ACFC25_13515 [Pseudarthrobacter sp. NPDC055928]|uniref:hypothetical protein n=1 Tax=Pseudarthrobacter sp. NPDC055928 TaxID=3345661 RepID=UPI0035E0921F